MLQSQFSRHSNSASSEKAPAAEELGLGSPGPSRWVRVHGLTPCEHSIAQDQQLQVSLASPFQAPCDIEDYTRNCRENDLLAAKGRRVPSQYEQSLRSQSVLVGDPIGGSSRHIQGYQAYPRATTVSERSLNEDVHLEQPYGAEQESTVGAWAPCGCYTGAATPKAGRQSVCEQSTCNQVKVPAFSKSYTIARQEAHKKGALVMVGLRVRVREGRSRVSMSECICKCSEGQTVLSSFARTWSKGVFPCICALTLHSPDTCRWTNCSVCSDRQYVVPPACLFLHAQNTDPQGLCVTVQFFFIICMLRAMILRNKQFAQDQVATLSRQNLASPLTYSLFSRACQPQVGSRQTFASDAVFTSWLLGCDTVPCVEAEHVRPRPQDGSGAIQEPQPCPPASALTVSASSPIALLIIKLYQMAPQSEECKAQSRSELASPGLQWHLRTLQCNIYQPLSYCTDGLHLELTEDHALWLIDVAQRFPRQVLQVARDAVPEINSVLSPKSPSSSPLPRLLPNDAPPTSSQLLSVLSKCPQKWVTSDAITQTFLTILKNAIKVSEPTYTISHIDRRNNQTYDDNNGRTPPVDIGHIRTPRVHPINELSAIKTLSVSKCAGLTTQSFVTISCLSSLQSLDLSFCPGLTDGMLALILTDKPHLRHLSISSCANLTGLVIGVLAYSQLTLETLDIGNLALSDSAMAPLLHWAEIEKGRACKPAFRELGQRPFFLNKLVSFKCAYNSSLTQAGLMWLSQCPMLSELDLNCTGVTDQSFLVTNTMPLNADGWAHTNEYMTQKDFEYPHLDVNHSSHNVHLDRPIYAQFPFLSRLSISNLTLKPHCLPLLHVRGLFPLLDYQNIARTYTGGTIPAGLLGDRLTFLNMDFTDLSEDGSFNVVQVQSIPPSPQVVTGSGVEEQSNTWLYSDIANTRMQLNPKHAPVTARLCYCSICLHELHPSRLTGSVSTGSISYYYPSSIVKSINREYHGLRSLSTQGQYLSTNFLQWVLQCNSLLEQNLSDCCTRDMRPLYYNNTQHHTIHVFKDSLLQLDYVLGATQVPFPMLDVTSTDFSRRGDNPFCQRFGYIGGQLTGAWRALWYGGCVQDHLGVHLSGQGGAAASSAYGDVEKTFYVLRIGAQDLLKQTMQRKLTQNGCLVGTCGIVAWTQCIDQISLEGSQLEHEWSHLAARDRQVQSSQVCSWVQRCEGYTCTDLELGSCGVGDDQMAVLLMDNGGTSSPCNTSGPWWLRLQRLGLSASCVSGATIHRISQLSKIGALRSVSFTGNMQLGDQDVVVLACSGKNTSSLTHVSLATTGATVKAQSLLAVARHMCCQTMFGCTSRGTKEMVENIPAHVVLGYPGKLLARKLHQALPKHMTDGEDDHKAEWCDGEEVRWRTEAGTVRVETLSDGQVQWELVDALETWRSGTEGGGTKTCQYMTGANVASSALVMTIEEQYKQYITTANNKE